MSARGTSTGSSALNTGAYSALPMPINATMPTMSALFGWSAKATKPSRLDSTPCSTVRLIRSFLRSTLSASMPPNVENSSSGPSWATIITPTKTAEPVSSYASAPSTTFCIQVPMFDANAPR